MGLPEGWIIKQAYVILLKLDKNKEVLVNNNWGKWERSWKLMVASRSWTWHFHFISIIVLVWVIPFTGHLSIGLSYHPSFGVNATNSSQCHQHVQEKSFSWETTIQLMPYPLQYLHPPFFMTAIPEPCVIRSFSLPENHLLRFVS